jgi:hypothetical protein
MMGFIRYAVKHWWCMTFHRKHHQRISWGWVVQDNDTRIVTRCLLCDHWSVTT